MSREREPLAVKNRSEQIVLDYNEVAADLIDVLRLHRRVFDPGVFEIVEPEVQLIAQLLADEFDAVCVWNSLNSDLGKGMLIGLLSESVQNYYTMLENRVEGDNDEEIDLNEN